MNFFDSSLQLPLSLVLVAMGFLFRLKAARARWALLSLAVLLQLRYLFWRGAFTLDVTTGVGLAVTGVLFLAELYGLFQNFFFYYQAGPRAPAAPAGEGGHLTGHPTVDVFVTIVNEPLFILKRTLVGCLAQDYPPERFTVHVLDDGGRDDVRELAASLGCAYLRRGDSSHAKAGNLNHALKHSRGELVAVFDVDHVPVRDFLLHTVGHFSDEKVAFVQSPHHFYNPDIFQKNLRLEADISNDQDMFFRVVQPGRDRHDSAFFAGSSAIFRRKALQDVGGFCTATLTEDLHTSMLLHARGWRSRYVNRVLSAGLSPESHAAYLKQRERWATGATQILLRDNPLCKGSLSRAQRTDYLGSIYYFFHGFPRLAYLVAPLAFLLFGVPPLHARPLDFLHYFFSYYVVSLFLLAVVGRGYRRAFWSDVYETMMSFSLCKAVLKAFVPSRRRTFHVTPKGEAGPLKRQWRSVLPHMALAGALALGIALNLHHRPHDTAAFLISVFWAGVNAVFVTLAIFAALEKPQRRRLLRLHRRIPCVVAGKHGEVGGETRDLSEQGVSVRLGGGLHFREPSVLVELRSSYGEVTRVKGLLRRQEQVEEGLEVGIEFRDVDEETSRSLVRQMYSPTESWQEPEGAPGGFLQDLRVLGRALWRPWKKDRAARRLHPRQPLVRPCTLTTAEGAEPLPARTLDVSRTGLALRLRSAGGCPEVLSTVRVEFDGMEVEATVMAREKGLHPTLHLRVEQVAAGSTIWEELTAWPFPAPKAGVVPAVQP
ncbi:MAG: glycosyltransferase [Nitrospirota bacterium]